MKDDPLIVFGTCLIHSLGVVGVLRASMNSISKQFQNYRKLECCGRGPYLTSKNGPVTFCFFFEVKKQTNAPAETTDREEDRQQELFESMSKYGPSYHSVTVGRETYEVCKRYCNLKPVGGKQNTFNDGARLTEVVVSGLVWHCMFRGRYGGCLCTDHHVSMSVLMYLSHVVDRKTCCHQENPRYVFGFGRCQTDRARNQTVEAFGRS